MKLNHSVIPKINMSGRGGSEKNFEPILESFCRVSQPLWDFENGLIKVELKKQKNLQWFDIGKYHNLTKLEKQIVMMFVIHDGEAILSIDTISLYDLLELACNDNHCRQDGWTHDNIKNCNLLKRSFPKMQVKVPLKVANFISEHREQFINLYSREAQ